MTCIVACLIVPTLDVCAHPSLSEYVHHRILVMTRPNNMDVTFEITFYGEHAQVERLRMDNDRDGRISGMEKQGYLKEIATETETSSYLEFDGKRVDLVPLYAPELDLLDDTGAGDHPHLLRLQYFARTTESLTAEPPLQIASELWIEAPALVTVEIATDDGKSLGHSCTTSPLPGGRRGEKRLLPLAHVDETINHGVAHESVNLTKGERR